MNSRYAAVLGAGSNLPKLDFLISQAWGDVPVSYFQDCENLDGCTFLDIKVNKWEVHGWWSSKQLGEPWIRVEMLRGAVLEEYVHSKGFPLFIDPACETLMVFELDDGGSILDDMLLLRLVSVFYNHFKVYRWSDRVEEISLSEIASIPALHEVHERLRKF